jgi:uncharacterized SAM-binding protein YcdF (DUF218 family)
MTSIQHRPLRLSGLVRWPLRLVFAAVTLLVLTGAGVTLHALWLIDRTGTPHPAEVIVVLGGGVRRDGSPGPDTLARVRHGVELFRRGLAPRLHFTGGHTNPDLPGLGTAMAAVATAEGVPAAAITVENASRSTLQNALLSRTVLPPAVTGAIIIVSDGYHLGRAWATFRWAGYGPVEVSAATGFGDGSWRVKVRRVARESLAWFYNAARLAAWATLNTLGFDQPDTSELLAHHATWGGAAA